MGNIAKKKMKFKLQGCALHIFKMAQWISDTIKTNTIDITQPYTKYINSVHCFQEGPDDKNPSNTDKQIIIKYFVQ